MKEAIINPDTKALVIGAGGMIGKVLVNTLKAAGHNVIGTTRSDLDLENVPPNLLARFGYPRTTYIVAAMTRFIDCEDHPMAYRVNVDAPTEIARQFGGGKVVYVSSEAVERALHTNYGMHKALAEIGVRRFCQYAVIARLSKVDPWSVDAACRFLAGLSSAPSGVYRWKAQPIAEMKVAGGVN